jgi:pimeloyl-ACP methyl ester carboxylesterase
MDATAFASLADVLAGGCTVITMDPRGIRRSQVDDRDLDVTPEVLAEDISALLSHLGVGPAAVFGSSGGAVAALALAIAHPDQVHTVVAHEPPLEELLDDRERLRANTVAMVQLHMAGDIAGAWQLFFAGADIAMSDESAPGWPADDDEPSVDPQAAADEAFFFAHTLRPSTWWQPDLEALAGSSARTVIGIGQESAGQVCDRTSRALASALGTSPVTFPGDHVGFVEHPELFAARLMSVLDEADRSMP